MESGTLRSKMKEFALVNLGLILTALSIVLFKAPNGFAMGGVSGISIILSKYFPNLNIGLIMLLINIVLDVIGFISLGSDFGLKTVYSSFALSFYVWLGEKIIVLNSPLTGDAMLELFFAIALPAVGSAIVFDQNSSTGGTDIVAKILSKKTHLHVGKTLLISDFLIAFSAIFALGTLQGLYSIFGIVVKSFLVDIVIENLNISKKVEIITSNPKPIEDFIINEMHRSATIAKAEGAFTHQEKTILMVVVNRQQAIKLRDFVHKIEKNPFIIITNSSEIIGKGFRNTNAL